MPHPETWKYVSDNNVEKEKSTNMNHLNKGDARDVVIKQTKNVISINKKTMVLKRETPYSPVLIYINLSCRFGNSNKVKIAAKK